jgi:hypothetical protein
LKGGFDLGKKIVHVEFPAEDIDADLAKVRDESVTMPEGAPAG